MRGLMNVRTSQQRPVASLLRVAAPYGGVLELQRLPLQELVAGYW